MEHRTKIICTMGPAVAGFEKTLQLIDAGMNVARLNFSHGTHQQHLHTINILKKAREARRVPLAIMLDTKGPEIRLGQVSNGQIEVHAGQKIVLVAEAVEGDGTKLSLHPTVALDAMQPGMNVLMADGSISARVLETMAGGVVIEIRNGGCLKTNNGVNLPDCCIALPAMTQEDIDDITFGCQHDIDLIAASFTRSAEHVLAMKTLLAQLGAPLVMVLAKIESSEGVRNFDAILEVADGIVVARGDLGVELPLAQVPGLQKMMIRHCIQSCKPVVTATQMLESMTKSPRPTRAEVSDVANAIYDSTSAVMLSGETAIGEYPIEAVAMMKRIILEAEKNFPYREFFDRESRFDAPGMSGALALAAVGIAHSIGAKALFVLTQSGFTARLISRYRPDVPILALTESVQIYHQLALHWGVMPADPTRVSNAQEGFEVCSRYALQKGLLVWGDPFVGTAGTPFGERGTTNTVVVENIGNVLVKGHIGRGRRVFGAIAVVYHWDGHDLERYQGKVVVLSHCDVTHRLLIGVAKGVILANLSEDRASEAYLLTTSAELDVPVMVCAAGACTQLKEGLEVTLVPEQKIVYKGRIDEMYLPH